MLSLNKTSSIVKGAALFDDPRTIAANPIAFVIDQTFAGLRPSFVGGSSLYNLQFTRSSASLISSSLCILIVMSCSLSRNQIFIFLRLILFFNQLHSRITKHGRRNRVFDGNNEYTKDSWLLERYIRWIFVLEEYQENKVVLERDEKLRPFDRMCHLVPGSRSSSY